MTLQTHFEKSGTWIFRYRSFLPLLVAPVVVAGLLSFTYINNSHEETELWCMVCILISLLGLAIRMYVGGYVPDGTSGRNTRGQRANSLNTTGLYSLVRHPLYLGNYLAMLGFLLFFRSLPIAIVGTFLFVFFYERIIFVEETFLRKQFGETFERWASATPTLVPRLHGWVSPQQPFSWRTVLRREYTGMLIIVGGFAILDTVADSIAEKRMHIDGYWVVVFSAAVAIYLGLRTLKKRTRLLHVEGR